MVKGHSEHTRSSPHTEAYMYRPSSVMSVIIYHQPIETEAEYC